MQFSFDSDFKKIEKCINLKKMIIINMLNLGSGDSTTRVEKFIFPQILIVIRLY